MPVNKKYPVAELMDALAHWNSTKKHKLTLEYILKNAGVTATLRIEKGHDIDAACGQLRLKQETAEGIL
jgi:adenine C2-methylase RlmN of 23S rRNA A2503 and tRNA A37